jgi:hypothetical protein
MPRTILWTPLLTGVLALFAGCKAAPVAVSIAELHDPARLAEVAPLYWKAEGAVIGTGRSDEQTPRIAFSSFVVDFITVKKESPFRSQPVIGVPPVTPIALALELTGLGRKRVLFSDTLKQDVALILQAETEYLIEAGRSVEFVRDEALRQNDAYADFRVSDADNTGVIRLANFFSTDTGQIRAMEALATPGYQIIDGTTTGETVEMVMGRLADEVGLDAVINARFRVGLYRGLASIDQGSRVDIVTADGRAVRLELQRTILSDRMVEGDGGFIPVQGERQVILSDDYIDQMAEMLPVALRMMFYVLDEHARTAEPATDPAPEPASDSAPLARAG